MKRTNKLAVLAGICAAVVAFGIGLAVLHAQNAVPETHGIAAASMDRSVKPGDNFYLYANGDWIKRTEIPPDRARIGVFTKLDEVSSKRTADLIQEVAKENPAEGTGSKKVASLYI